MKITIITSPFGYIPPNAFGAVERAWYDISKEFVRMGHSITFISKQPDSISKTEQEGIHIKFIKGYKWTGSLKMDLVLDFIYSRKALKAVGETDILIMNTFWTPLLHKFYGRKKRVSVYQVQRFPKGQYKYFGHIDRLACCSTAIKNAILKQAPQRANALKVINNPVNLNAFKYKAKEKNKKEINIVFTGRIHPEKGLHILAETYGKLKKEYLDLSLTLIGPSDISQGGGGKDYLDTLNRLADNASITYVPPISDPKLLASYIQCCDIYCYPSVAALGEAMPCAPLEAMATGTPVVVSNLDCFSDYIFNGKNGLIFDYQNNPEKNLYLCLKELINNSGLREEFGNAGAEIALNFSTDKIAELYISDFSQLIEQKCIDYNTKHQ